MKKLKFVVLFVLLFALFGINAKATECSDSLKSQAAKVKTSAPYKTEMYEGEWIEYHDVTVDGLTSDMKAYAYLCGERVQKFTKNSNHSALEIYETVCNTTVDVYSNGKSCDNDVLLAKVKLHIPLYNPYSKKNICKKYNDYKYCQQEINDKNIILLDVEQKIKALEKRDPEAAKTTKSNNIFTKIIYIKIHIILFNEIYKYCMSSFI